MKINKTNNKYSIISVYLLEKVNGIRTVRMKYLAVAIILGLALNGFAQQNKQGKINIGFIYPISTNGNHAVLDTNVFSFSALIGVSAAERGVSLAGLSNVIRRNAKGFQLAGFSNHTGNKMEGIQLAGFMNTYGGGNGAAVSGFANISKENSGTQVAGFINVAKKVKGVQIAGFINVADSSDYPIGLINIVKNGEMSVAFTTNQHLTTLATFKSGGKVLYGIIGVGYNFENKEEVYALEVGFGAHFLQSEYFRLNAELTAGSLHKKSFESGKYFRGTFQLMPSLRIGKYLDIFAGPSINLVSTESDEGKALQKKYLKTWDKNTHTLNGLFVGYTGGISINF